MNKDIIQFLWEIGNDYEYKYDSVLVDKARDLFLKYSKPKINKIKGYLDYNFHNIPCMISFDNRELGFFKSGIDKRPSQAIYIDLEKAEKIYQVFKVNKKEKERKKQMSKIYPYYKCKKCGYASFNQRINNKCPSCKNETLVERESVGK